MPVQHGVLDDPSTGTTWFWSCNYKLPDPDPHRDPYGHAKPHGDAQPYGHAKGWDDPQKIAGRHKIVNSFGDIVWWQRLVDYCLYLKNNHNAELPKC